MFDSDDDGVCDDDEIVGYQDDTACDYNENATDAGDCTYVDGICETCEDGIIVDNDADDDTVCDVDEVVGCQDETACDYNENATDAGDCTYVDGVCETCEDGIIVDNDLDDDGVCNDDEVVGCTYDTACNFNSAATDDNSSCIFVDGICESCSGETDGSGLVIDNDVDNDTVCDLSLIHI